MRNKGLLGDNYFNCLARHPVAHVFNSWSEMPTVAEQSAMAGGRTNPQLVAVRLLLTPGRKYEAAVKAFQPYAEGKLTLDEIAAKYDVNPMTINSWVRKASLPPRSRGRLKMVEPGSRQKQIINLARISTYRTAGRQFGISRQAVFQIVDKWGLPKSKMQKRLGGLSHYRGTTGIRRVRGFALTH